MRRHDELLTEILNTIKTNGEPATSAVWINSSDQIIFFGLRHIQYYLPAYNIYAGAPQSFVRLDDLNIWHVRGPQFDKFEKTAVIPAGVTKLFTIRATWTSLHTQFEIPLLLPNDRTLVYYDLTDSATRDYLSTQYKFEFATS